MKRVLLTLALAAMTTTAGAVATAQTTATPAVPAAPTAPQHIRGTVASLSGDVLVVRPRRGLRRSP